MQCTNCQKWVHRKCIKSSMIKVSKSFVCRGYHPASVDRISMDIGDGASLELVDMFCYLGDMLSVDGDADAAAEARVCKRWNKFTNKDVCSLLMRGKLYRSCVFNCMLHGCETWSVKKENKLTLQWAEMRMITWRCGIGVTGSHVGS